jgi:hypothetical protein
MLKIRVRYTRVEVQADVVAATLRLMQPIPHGNVRDIGIGHIVPGTLFVRQGQLVEEISVNNNDVLVLDDHANNVMITVNEATELLNEYIG